MEEVTPEEVVADNRITATNLPTEDGKPDGRFTGELDGALDIGFSYERGEVEAPNIQKCSNSTTINNNTVWLRQSARQNLRTTIKFHKF